MSCKAGHILNLDGYCRLCGAWLVDVEGPLSPFPRDEENAERGNDAGPEEHKGEVGKS